MFGDVADGFDAGVEGVVGDEVFGGGLPLRADFILQQVRHRTALALLPSLLSSLLPSLLAPPFIAERVLPQRGDRVELFALEAYCVFLEFVAVVFDI